MTQNPAAPNVALARMRQLANLPHLRYRLGTGNYNPGGFALEYDCAGAICEAYELTRHRPGYARGALPVGWTSFADVVDDINTNSMIKDALLKQEVFRFVPLGEPLEQGDCLAYPTIKIVDHDHNVHTFIGHVQMVEEPHGAEAGGPYSGVGVLHCHGPDGRAPGVTRGNAHVMDIHNQVWPKEIHRAWALRAVR